MNLARILCFALAGAGMTASTAAFSQGLTIANNKPKFTSSAKKVGAVEASTAIEVSVWLKPHDRAGMDEAAKDLYDPRSANYRHFLTKAEFAKKYAPTEAEAKTVKEFFTSNKMTIVKMGENNFYVRAKGTVADVSKAFHVALNNYEVNGKTVRANAEDPYITGEAAKLVRSVAGLDSMEYAHPLVSKMSLRKPMAKTAAGVTAGAVAESAMTLERANAEATKAAGTSLAFNSDCFPGETTQEFKTMGGLPIAKYTGNEYTTNAAGCGYTPANIRAAYSLNALYAEGFDGTGQTIVIVDWCGSPTIESDANAFSAQFGLPKLTSKNFKIIYTPTPSYCEAPDPEINIDVEWAHAIAPGAKIDLVVPPSASFQDIDEALFYSINYQLGGVISGSFGSEELYTPESTLQTEELITEVAAVMGISANFSTGDDGDFTFDDAADNPASVSAPASSPYATGVGGISLALNKNNTIAWEAGWGTNENVLSYEAEVEDPPANQGYFNFGSGGGMSEFFDKPYFQHKLKGTGRQLPDISWLGDPFTGAYIAISEPLMTPELTYQVYGGTSLACPMFSALWAIANQESGIPLGQAAPYLYTMPASTITDIVPYASKTNVTGLVADSEGKKSYTAAQLAEPLEGVTKYVSVLWDYPLLEDTAVLLTFGTDSGLKTATGWDNVTGLGVPKGKAFADYFNPF